MTEALIFFGLLLALLVGMVWAGIVIDSEEHERKADMGFFIASLKTAGVALVGALIPIITQLAKSDTLPTTTAGWVGVFVAAGAAAGFYHLPSPSMQSKG